MHNDCDLVFYIDYVMVLHDTTPIQPYKMSCNGRFVYWVMGFLQPPQESITNRFQRTKKSNTKSWDEARLEYAIEIDKQFRSVATNKD